MTFRIHHKVGRLIKNQLFSSKKMSPPCYHSQIKTDKNRQKRIQGMHFNNNILYQH